MRRVMCEVCKALQLKKKLQKQNQASFMRVLMEDTIWSNFMVAIDTNIIIRFFTRDDESQYESAFRLIDTNEIFIA